MGIKILYNQLLTNHRTIARKLQYGQLLCYLKFVTVHVFVVYDKYEKYKFYIAQRCWEDLQLEN